jgi:hypothetical protein
VLKEFASEELILHNDEDNEETFVWMPLRLVTVFHAVKDIAFIVVESALKFADSPDMLVFVTPIFESKYFASVEETFVMFAHIFAESPVI